MNLKIFVIIILMLYPNTKKGYDGFDDIFKHINKHKVKAVKVSEGLTPIYVRENSSDTTLYIEPSLSNIRF